jgi:hypothetical protein
VTQDSGQSDAVQRARQIAGQLRDLEERLQSASSAEVQLSLLERATALAEEAAQLLEQISRETL